MGLDDKMSKKMEDQNSAIQEIDHKIDSLTQLSNKNVQIIKQLDVVEKKSQIAKRAIAYIKENKADLVLIGTRALTGLEKSFSTSVSDVIIKSVACPVFVFKKNSEV